MAPSQKGDSEPGAEVAVETLFDMALADPGAALEQANRWIDQPLAPAARAGVLRARALSHRMLGDLDTSASDAELAMAIAEDLGDRELWTRAALTLAGTRLHQGHATQARSLLRRGIESTQGIVQGEAVFQLGTLYAQTGDTDRALANYKQALPVIRKHGRLDWESQLLGNRGIIHIMVGHHRRAIRDLDRAIELQLELGIAAQAALNMHNKARALYMLGDLSGSLDTYAEAERRQGELGMPVHMYAEKCDAYMAAGLFEDCLALAARSHRLNNRGGAAVNVMTSLMIGADAALALGRTEQAVELATAVINTKGADDYPGWVARARLTIIEARLRAGTATLDDATAAAEHFGPAVQADPSAASRALLIAAEIEFTNGLFDPAARRLRAADQVVARSPLHLQIERFKLVAEVRKAMGNKQAMAAAVRAGMRRFDRLLGGATAYDVRVRATRHAERLTELGVSAHLSAGRLDSAEAMIEELRSAALRWPAPTDSTTRFIAAESRLRRAAPGAAQGMVRLERSLNGSEAPHGIEAHARADETLLTFVELDGELHCVVTGSTGDRTARFCGRIDTIADLVADQGWGYRQLARRTRLSSTAINDVSDRTEIANGALAKTLLPATLGERVVINPSPGLASVVWGGLRGLTERPHVVSPAREFSHRNLDRQRGAVRAVGSSELAHVAAEINAVAQAHDATSYLDPDREILTELGGLDVLHLAGHFVNTGANPLLAGLELGSFKLRGSDYLKLDPAPSLCVVSACDSGATETVGGAPAGFAPTALAAGTATVIVTQTIVEDGTGLVHVMTKLHELLAQDVNPAEALNHVRSTATDRDRALAQTLLAIGTGW